MAPATRTGTVTFTRYLVGMNGQTIRAAYSQWPRYNRVLTEVVGVLTPAQLAIRPSPERWPLWATLGHLACQRVFWLGDFAGVPGTADTPFTNAAYDCPGDDDLDNGLGPEDLVNALTSTFRMVDTCLDTWTIESLSEEITRPDFGPDWVHTRGAVIQRVYSHDMWHAGQVSQTLGINGLSGLDVWG
ncbi:MAG TPA: DinB family protein [Trueperaceae bacterium]|nr:DinB family protein [Trueperaceae bacterium]